MTDPLLPPPPGGQMLIYRDGALNLQVRLDGETVWLTQAAMAELYQTTKQNISLHVQNILAEGELVPESVVKEYLTTAADGKRYRTLHYNLDMILAIGYRVRSPRGTLFRQWATARLRELLVKGFTLDDERIKAGRTLGDDCFDELLARIRDIRAGEERLRRPPRPSQRWLVYAPFWPCGRRANAVYFLLRRQGDAQTVLSATSLAVEGFQVLLPFSCVKKGLLRTADQGRIA